MSGNVQAGDQHIINYDQFKAHYGEPDPWRALGITMEEYQHQFFQSIAKS